MGMQQIVPPVGSPCPECQAPRFPARATGYGANPVRLVRLGAVFGFNNTTCTALVCPRCGHTTLYANQPWRLLQ